jgi:hypothetical protein
MNSFWPHTHRSCARARQLVTTSVYSLHKSSTREASLFLLCCLRGGNAHCRAAVLSSRRHMIDRRHAQHIVRKAEEWGVGVEVLAEMRFDLPKTQVLCPCCWFGCFGAAFGMGTMPH